MFKKSLLKSSIKQSPFLRSNLLISNNYNPNFIRKNSDNIFKYGKFNSRGNYGINFLPSGHSYIVERFGKFTGTIHNPGLAYLIPFIDKIAYVVDNREMTLRIDPQPATTEDNVMITLGGSLFLKFYDPVKACYAVTTPIYAAQQLAQSLMRTSVGKLRLDKLFQERGQLNSNITESMKEGASAWGCEIIRFEITDLKPIDDAVTDALHKQSTAERDRREKVINADAFKQEVEAQSNAYKYKQTTEASGNADKIKIETEAQVFNIMKKAEAEAYSIKINALAQKEALEMIGEAIKKEGGESAVLKQLSEKYIEQLGNLAKASNTIVIPQNLADVSSLVASGYSAYKNLKLN